MANFIQNIRELRFHLNNPLMERVSAKLERTQL